MCATAYLLVACDQTARWGATCAVRGAKDAAEVAYGSTNPGMAGIVARTRVRNVSTTGSQT